MESKLGGELERLEDLAVSWGEGRRKRSGPLHGSWNLTRSQASGMTYVMSQRNGLGHRALIFEQPNRWRGGKIQSEVREARQGRLSLERCIDVIQCRRIACTFPCYRSSSCLYTLLVSTTLCFEMRTCELLPFECLSSRAPRRLEAECSLSDWSTLYFR